MFYFHPYLGKITNLTNIFQVGWNHQLEMFFFYNGLELLKAMHTASQTSNPRSWTRMASHAFLIVWIPSSPLLYVVLTDRIATFWVSHRYGSWSSMGWSGDKLEATCAIALGPGHRKKGGVCGDAWRATNVRVDKCWSLDVFWFLIPDFFFRSVAKMGFTMMNSTKNRDDSTSFPSPPKSKPCGLHLRFHCNFQIFPIHNIVCSTKHDQAGRVSYRRRILPATCKGPHQPTGSRACRFANIRAPGGRFLCLVGCDPGWIWVGACHIPRKTLKHRSI